MGETSYILDAIERFKAGMLEGSHAQGVFNEAAKRYEKIVKQKFREFIKINKINFDTVVRPKLKGSPSLEKLTLGMLIYAFKLIDKEKLNFFSALFREKTNTDEILLEMSKVNDFWKNKIKHGSGFTNREALSYLQNMCNTLEAFVF